MSGQDNQLPENAIWRTRLGKLVAGRIGMNSQLVWSWSEDAEAR